MSGEILVVLLIFGYETKHWDLFFGRGFDWLGFWMQLSDLLVGGNLV